MCLMSYHARSIINRSQLCLVIAARLLQALKPYSGCAHRYGVSPALVKAGTRPKLAVAGHAAMADENTAINSPCTLVGACVMAYRYPNN